LSPAPTVPPSSGTTSCPAPASPSPAMTGSPACRSAEIRSHRARRRQDAWRALVNPRIAAASCGPGPASARPSPLRRPPGSMERPARGGRHPLARPDGGRPGLRLQPGPPGHTGSRRLVTSLTRASGLSAARFYGSSRPGPSRPGPAGRVPGDIRRAPCGARGRLTAAPGRPAPRTGGAVNRSLSPRSVRLRYRPRPAKTFIPEQQRKHSTAPRPRISAGDR
jgi:hypothetical protein